MKRARAKTTDPENTSVSSEARRLAQDRPPGTPWKKWGPYLSERQWGTVREDYSDLGQAWDSFSHDQARSRAYRWGEDGLAGISDDMNGQMKRVARGKAPGAEAPSRPRPCVSAHRRRG